MSRCSGPLAFVAAFVQRDPALARFAQWYADMTTTHLQGIGIVNAKPAKDFAPGETMAWNAGETSTVVSVRQVSACYVEITERSNGKTFVRRFKNDRLIAIG